MSKKIDSKYSGMTKPIVIAIITIVILVVLITFLLLRPVGETTAGKAVHIQKSTAVPSAANAVFLQYEEATAAPNDYVKVPIKFKTDGINKVATAEFSVNFNKQVFSIDSSIVGVNNKLPVSGVLPWAGTAAENADFLQNDGSAVLTTSSVMSPTSGTEYTLATLYFKVIGDYNPAETPYTFTVNFVRLEGVDALNDVVDIIAPGDFVPLQYSVVIVPECADGDNDGWGTGTELRGCGGNSGENLAATLAADCDDNDNERNPEFNEKCDGKDNDCNDQEDDGLTHSANVQKFLGVCSGKQICILDAADNTWKMEDSYLINPNDVSAGQSQFVIKLTSPEGIEYQQYDLYSTDETNCGDECCDLFDNDCDGQINEGLSNCDLGGESGPAIVADLSGNTFIDPFSWVDGGQILSDSQVIDPLDQSLLAQMKVAHTMGGCGNAGESLCGIISPQDVDGIPVWLCYDGLYYLDYPDFGLTRFSPNEDLVVLNGANRDNAINDIISGVITCAGE